MLVLVRELSAKTPLAGTHFHDLAVVKSTHSDLHTRETRYARERRQRRDAARLRGRERAAINYL